MKLDETTRNIIRNEFRASHAKLVSDKSMAEVRIYHEGYMNGIIAGMNMIDVMFAGELLELKTELDPI